MDDRVQSSASTPTTSPVIRRRSAWTLCTRSETTRVIELSPTSSLKTRDVRCLRVVAARWPRSLRRSWVLGGQCQLQRVHSCFYRLVATVRFTARRRIGTWMSCVALILPVFSTTCSACAGACVPRDCRTRRCEYVYYEPSQNTMHDDDT